MGRWWMLGALLFSGTAFADAPIGEWKSGRAALHVAADGRFDWTVGAQKTDGDWASTDALVSLQTPTKELTYAWSVEGDTLTLTDASGGRLVFERAEEARRR